MSLCLYDVTVLPTLPLWNCNIVHTYFSIHSSGYSEIYLEQRSQKDLCKLHTGSSPIFLLRGTSANCLLWMGRDKTYLEILCAAAFLTTACLWFAGGFGTSWEGILWDGITLCKLAAFWRLEVALDVLCTPEPAGIDTWLVLDCE